MILADFAVKRPITVIMLIMIVLILGMVSLTRIGIDLLPEMTFPVAAVITDYSGVGPQEIENLITRPLEETLGTVTNVKEITSTSSSGSSLVLVEFEWGTDMDFAALEMREKIDMIGGWLPDDAGQPLVFKFDPSMMPVMVIGMGGNVDNARLKELAEDNVKPRLERLDGVASVDVQGGLDREIRVGLQPAALAKYGLSIDQVVQTLAGENLNLPGGSIREGQKELLLRTAGEFTRVEDIEELSLLTQGGVPVKVRDLGTVVDGYAETRAIALLNGQPAVGLVVQKQTGANTAQVGNMVRAELAALSQLQQELQFTYVFDQSEFINDTINNMARNTLAGALLAVFILLLFLRNFRSTLIIATVIPIAVVGTFILVHFTGLTLNIMTLGGMALGVGMLVDNAIVILENIFRFREEGHSRMDAARLGAAEVGKAVTASTLTTIGVFLPIVYVQGMISEIFRQLALTVTFALLSSLVVSLTLIPLLSSRILKVEKNGEGKGFLQRYSRRFEEKLRQLEDVYGRTLAWCLDNKKKVVAGAVAVLILALALVPLVGSEFFPGSDEGSINISVRLPLGSPLETTEGVALAVAEMVNQVPEVQDVFLTIGGGGQMGMGGGGTQRAALDVRLLPLAERDRSTEVVAEEMRTLVEGVPGADIRVSASSMMMGGGMDGGSPVSIAVKGDDLDRLGEISDQIVEVIEDIPGIRNPTTSVTDGRPQLEVRPNRQRLAALGLTTGQVARSIDTALQGRVATQLRVGGEEIDIRVQLDGEQNRQQLERLPLSSPTGIMLTLGDVAEFVVEDGPRSINREDQVRLVTVTADVSGRDLGSVMADVRSQVEVLLLPEGYRLEYGGDYQEMADAFGGLGLALILAIILVYAILASQFESLVHPFTIMFSVPFAVTGAVLGLLVTGHSLSVPSAIGGVMLAGIVVNNAIVLVDYVNTLRGQGMALTEAVVQAGRTRLRPILMTTSTTVLALLPLALGIGTGAEMQAPLAVVVIGGLVSSTFLTLFIVPTAYTVVEGIDIRAGFKRIRARIGISR